MNGKRTRGRAGRSKPSNPRNQTFDSSGPEGKVRGTANQVFEKYLALARDAQSSGDRIGAENFFQHAEHYYRIINGFGQNDRARSQGNGGAQSQTVNGHANGRRTATTAGERPGGSQQEAREAEDPRTSKTDEATGSTASEAAET